MKKKILYLLVVTIFGCFALVGCGKNPTPGPGPGPGPGTTDDDFYTKGYTKAESVTEKEIYKDFLGGIYNPLKKSGTGTLSPTVPYINMEYSFEVRVNQMNFTVNYKRFFNYNDPDTQSMMFSFWETDVAESIATMYYFAGEKEDALYFQLGNDTKNPTEIFVPIEKENIFRFVPSDVKNQSEFYSSTLEKLFQVSGTPKCEYRRSNGVYTRHYRIDLDMQKTLSKLLDFAETTQNFIPVASVEFLLENILDVSKEDVRKENVPKMAVNFEFWTANGEEDFGVGILDRCIAKVKIYDKADPKQCNKDTTFEIKKFSVLNTAKGEIEKKDFSNYTDFFSSPFRIQANLQQNGVPMDLQIDFRVSSDLRPDVELDESEAFTGRMYGFAKNRNTGKKEMEMSYLDGTFKMKLNLGKKKVEFTLPMDLEKVIGKVASDFYYSDQKADYMKVLTYLVGNFNSHTSSLFSMALNRTFFEEILTVKPEEFLEVMQEFTAEGVSVPEVLLGAGWTVEEARDYLFTLFIDLDDVHTLIAPISNRDLKIPEAFEA